MSLPAQIAVNGPEAGPGITLTGGIDLAAILHHLARLKTHPLREDEMRRHFTQILRPFRVPGILHIDPVEAHVEVSLTGRDRQLLEHIQTAIAAQSSAADQAFGDDRAVDAHLQAVFRGQTLARDRLPHVLRDVRQLLLALLAAFLDALRTRTPREPQHRIR